MSAGLKDDSFPGAKRHLREVRRLMYMGEKEVPPCSEESQNREGDVKRKCRSVEGACWFDERKAFKIKRKRYLYSLF